MENWTARALQVPHPPAVPHVAKEGAAGKVAEAQDTHVAVIRGGQQRCRTPRCVAGHFEGHAADEVEDEPRALYVLPSCRRETHPLARAEVVGVGEVVGRPERV